MPNVCEERGSVMKEESFNFKYILIPGNFPKDNKNQILHNKAYLFWKNFWNEVLKENGTNHTVSPDNFWRQNIVSLIMCGEEIVGMHLYSFFNTRSLAALDHSYMVHSFTADYMEKLSQKNSKNLMSIEYLTVAKGWRKKDIGISLSAVLLTLACKYQKDLNLDALVAPSRSDNKVTETILDLGGEILVGDLEMHNTPVDLIAIFNDQDHLHPNSNVNKLANQLWESKIDTTGILPENLERLIAA